MKDIEELKDIKERFENNELLGYIKFKSVGNFYLMPIAYWILNYKKYDPSYDPKEWSFVFRDNILNVTDDFVSDFLSSIEKDKTSLKELKSSLEHIPEEIVLRFYIDFDEKLFVSSFEDIEVETYLPDKQWKGMHDRPSLCLPIELRELFKNI
ncbi:MAG: hypothetical protein JST68_20500 [Bacteroidetes bacterium]|nr:hypothetical protein [Bacteroidota bacterium]